MLLKIDTDELQILANKLERISRSAFPVAVRGALNNAAFDVKKNTMPRTAKDEFIHRQPNFFKANSRVKMATGFDVNSMESTIGFTPEGLKGGSTNYAVKDLEQQERGGTIGGRSFIPLKEARSSGSNAKPVRPSNRLTDKKNIKNVGNAKGNKWGVKAIKTAIHAGVGGLILATGGQGPQTSGQLWRVKSINRSSGRTIFKVEKLYSFGKSRKVNVQKTNFMRRASEWSGSKLEKFFIEQATKQFNKI